MWLLGKFHRRDKWPQLSFWLSINYSWHFPISLTPYWFLPKVWLSSQMCGNWLMWESIKAYNTFKTFDYEMSSTSTDDQSFQSKVAWSNRMIDWKTVASWIRSSVVKNKRQLILYDEHLDRSVTCSKKLIIEERMTKLKLIKMLKNNKVIRK